MRLTTRRVVPVFLGCLFPVLLPVPLPTQAAAPIPKVISIRQEASDQERLAAYEVQRYVYLRTGKLLKVRRGFLSQMVKLRMNFFGLHTYPSWNPSAGPEANVWIGLPEDVDAHGNVRFGYGPRSGA